MTVKKIELKTGEKCKNTECSVRFGCIDSTHCGNSCGEFFVPTMNNGVNVRECMSYQVD